MTEVEMTEDRGWMQNSLFSEFCLPLLCIFKI